MELPEDKPDVPENCFLDALWMTVGYTMFYFGFLSPAWNLIKEII